MLKILMSGLLKYDRNLNLAKDLFPKKNRWQVERSFSGLNFGED
jgi:hypothetical protein